MNQAPQYARVRSQALRGLTAERLEALLQLTLANQRMEGLVLLREEVDQVRDRLQAQIRVAQEQGEGK